MRPLVTHSKQQGMALVVSLVVLVILTILGLVALRSALIENRSIQSAIDLNVSFNAAEMGLREAENWLKAQEEPPECDAGCEGYVVIAEGDPQFSHSPDFLDLSRPDWQGQANAGTVKLDKSIDTAYFVIRHVKIFSDANGDEGFLYEITSVGYGSTDKTRTILQSAVMRGFEDEPYSLRKTWRYVQAN